MTERRRIKRNKYITLAVFAGVIVMLLCFALRHNPESAENISVKKLNINGITRIELSVIPTDGSAKVLDKAQMKEFTALLQSAEIKVPQDTEENEELSYGAMLVIKILDGNSDEHRITVFNNTLMADELSSSFISSESAERLFDFFDAQLER